MKIRFKDFILNEGKADTTYLAGKIGDLLAALQELQDNMGGMGTRQLTKSSALIVNQIRSILHVTWGKEEVKHLATLQKIGVAIMKAVEEKEGLTDVLASATAELQKTTQDMGVPINTLGEPAKAPPEPETLAPPAGEEEKEAPKPQGQEQAPPPPPQGQEAPQPPAGGQVPPPPTPGAPPPQPPPASLPMR